MFGSKPVPRNAGEAATFVLPKDWVLRQDPARPSPAWAAFKIVKSQSFHFGAGDPLEVEGYVVVTAPGSSEAELAEGMDFAFQEVQQRASRFSEFGNLKTGARTTWISEGNYQIGSNHDPEKTIFLRAVDPQLQAALVLRVYTRKVPHEALRKSEHAFFDSFRYLDTRGKFFGEPPASDRAKQTRAAELRILNRALAARGLKELSVPASGRSAVEAHNGWIYHVEAGRFWIGRRIYDDRTVRQGLASIEYKAEKWTATGMGQQAAERWAKALALDTDRTRRYRFAVFHCDFTPFDAETFPEPKWDLHGWMRTVEAEPQ